MLRVGYLLWSVVTGRFAPWTFRPRLWTFRPRLLFYVFVVF